MVRRIFTEKKKGFDIEAQGMYRDLKQDLDLPNLEGVRIVNRYDIQGISDEMYAAARETVFSEPTVDCVYDEVPPADLPQACFATEYLPGQYDQRADSAVQCIRLMDFNEEPEIRFARVIALEGAVTPAELDAVKRYCINPVESREALWDKPEQIEIEFTLPGKVAVVEGFMDYNAEALAAFREEMSFAMTDADMQAIQAYFKNEEKRNPTVTELKVLDTYWSDHCRHTTFHTVLSDIDFETGEYADVVQAAFDEYMAMRREVYGEREQSKDLCLMDMASIGTKYLKKQGLCDDVDESEEINACSINVKAKIDGKEEDWLVMFKNETHNHPTEIEPFGGAATCLGGAIRDPLSGRVYVYQAMRVTGAGDPRNKDTLQGKLSQKKITVGAAAGYSSYGNQIGLATGQVDEIYDPGYVAKRMEVGAVIGAAPKAHVRRERPAKGDLIILLGGRTGRDGCGGATGSSKEHTEDSILTCGAEVQKGNPPVERNIQRMFRRKEVTLLIKRCNDFGAGGVSVAIGELADSLDVNLDRVPKKYEGLDGTELAISESQERMAVVVDAVDAEKFIALAKEENLEATVVAEVTDTGRFRMTWRGDTILDLSRAFINTNGAKQEASVLVQDKKPEDIKRAFDMPPGEQSLAESMRSALADLNCCGKKGLIERFDCSIGAGTVLAPLGGKYRLTPAAGMAAKLPVTEGECETATLMAYGFDPALANASPYHSALYAVIHSTTKIVAMGGVLERTRLTFQEYFEKLTTSASWAKPFSALLGALKAQKELGIPSIGGKDSMSGTFMDLNVPPTLISFAVCAGDVAHIVSQEFKKAGSTLVLFTIKKDENQVIDFEAYKGNMVKVAELAANGKLLAADAIGKGGLFTATYKMASGNRIGAEIASGCKPCLFRADYGAILAEIDAAEDLEQLLEGAQYKVVGKTTDTEILKVRAGEDGAEISLAEAYQINMAPLEEIFPVRTDDFKAVRDESPVAAPSYTERSTRKPAVRIAAPRVIIPTFPGTNCEQDSKKAFAAAGAEAEILLIRNINAQVLDESIRAFEEKIRQSQIIMIPGGFSGGDEPDGSAKFITAVFRNARIKDAVADLLEKRDGLILGICNGFQALIKLGLVPYGTIIDSDCAAPTLTYNKIGRHVACFVDTRVASVKSPWLANTNVGDIHTLPVSHGEGRFIASDEVLATLIDNGQIATQYVDVSGRPSLDISANPNGSMLAVEGLTSPDGRVFGKMAHSERIGTGVHKNIGGNTDQGIFAAGVRYFV